MGTVRDLKVFMIAFDLAMDIYNICKRFPVEEKYSLTSQIVRSSRSVCACIAEAYTKRRYKAHFISKLSDADMENTETQVWLLFAFQCAYINEEKYNDLLDRCRQVGRLLNYMMSQPEKFIWQSSQSIEK